MKIFLFLMILTTPSLLYPAKVKEFRGMVEVRLPGESIWIPVENGLEIPVGTQVSTAHESSVLLDLGSSEIRLMPLGRIELQTVIESEAGFSVSLLLRAGRIRADVKNQENRTHYFTVMTPISTAVVRGRSFIFNGYFLEALDGIILYINAIGERILIPEGLTSRTTGLSSPSSSFLLAEEAVNLSVSPLGPHAPPWERDFMEDTTCRLKEAGDAGIPDIQNVNLNFFVE
ncbi:MAG: hypothetical protein JEY99_02975 [Spirochaetales bacterium]|nr:hypothetical protein [Spirochaetales bacterium]